MKEWGDPLFCFAGGFSLPTLRIIEKVTQTMSDKSKNVKKGGKNTAAAVWEIVQPIAEGLGLKLWDVRFVKEGASWYLRIVIDKEGGVSITDCENMSRAVDGPLDEADPIDQSYFLEVWSPGIERELTRPEHYEAMAGREICVTLYRPIDGEKEIIADLVGLRDKNIVMTDLDGTEFEIPLKDASSVRLTDEDIEEELIASESEELEAEGEEEYTDEFIEDDEEPGEE